MKTQNFGQTPDWTVDLSNVEISTTSFDGKLNFMNDTRVGAIFDFNYDLIHLPQKEWTAMAEKITTHF